MGVELRIASYTLLADAYLKPEGFPHTPVAVFHYWERPDRPVVRRT